MWYTYIIKSQTKEWYYVGSTNDPERRLREHNLGKVNSTRPHRPLHQIFTKEFSSEAAARQYERKVKDKRIEKEQIIKKWKNHCRLV